MRIESGVTSRQDLPNSPPLPPNVHRCPPHQRFSQRPRLGMKCNRQQLESQMHERMSEKPLGQTFGGMNGLTGQWDDRPLSFSSTLCRAIFCGHIRVFSKHRPHPSAFPGSSGRFLLVQRIKPTPGLCCRSASEASAPAALPSLSESFIFSCTSEFPQITSGEPHIHSKDCPG